MEEADAILLLTLSRAGCAVPDRVTSVSQVLEEDALVRIAASCLRAIHPAAGAYTRPLLSST
jgi:hypothetical protein